MKSMIYYFGLASMAMASVLNSCGEPTKRDAQIRRYSKHFRNEYVKKDFGNPHDFIKITDIIITDTIKVSSVKNVLLSAKTVAAVMGDTELAAKADILVARVEREKGLVSYTVKARIKEDGVRKVKEYKFVENLTNGRIGCGNSERPENEIPAIYVDVAKYVSEVKHKIDSK